jgi:hypothetical protein
MTRPESAEGKIITSLLDNDITTAIEILADFHPHELNEFEAALVLAEDLVVRCRRYDQQHPTEDKP